MKNRFAQSAAGALLLALCLSVCSCVSTDPHFTANFNNIQNTNYPADKVLGTWAAMFIKPIQTSGSSTEGKVYYDLRPGGQGTVRQADRNTNTGHAISIEANLRWKYLGGNRWTITLPPSTEYHVVSTDHMAMGYRPAVSMTLRYYNDELYVTPGNAVWVRADEAHVSELSRRLRSNPPLLQITVDQ